MGPFPLIAGPGLNVVPDHARSGEGLACQRADQRVPVVAPMDTTEMRA